MPRPNPVTVPLGSVTGSPPSSTNSSNGMLGVGTSLSSMLEVEYAVVTESALVRAWQISLATS